MPTAIAMGTFVSLCTVQKPDGAVNPDGTPSNGFMDAGIVDLYTGQSQIACMDAVPSDARIQATERKDLEEIMAAAYRHVLLDACYPQILAGVGNGWRVIVDGVKYDLLGAEDDSQGQMTRLELQLVTV